jgi:hypothetical protein
MEEFMNQDSRWHQALKVSTLYHGGSEDQLVANQHLQKAHCPEHHAAAANPKSFGRHGKVSGLGPAPFKLICEISEDSC